jgi:long-subunit acyl-CoA synthetase (AMP-forming)
MRKMTTVMEVFENTVHRHLNTSALKRKVNGQWVSITWREYREQVLRTARGFMKLGLQPGDGVSIVGYNCPEWLYSDLGAIAAGGVPAGIYTTSSPQQCQYIAAHSDSSIVVVENDEHLKKFLKIRDQLPRLKAIVQMQGKGDASAVSWDEMLALGEQVPESELRCRIEAQKPKDLATLIYTSGTTGDPKAVMLSHSNLTWIGQAIVREIGTQAGDRVISYLPLSHIAEQNVSIHGPLATGIEVWFAESMEKLGENLREARPTFFVGVPRVWEKIQARMQAIGANSPPLRRKIAAWARRVGIEARDRAERGESPPLQYYLADKLVFSKVRAALGMAECRHRATGAAPISRETMDYFASLGMPLYEVYGQSETTGAGSLGKPGASRVGTLGKAYQGTEMKIAEDGEICLRGPYVMLGYLKNEQATREAIDEDGWCHTGDVGEIDADGFLRITDRKKELIITAGGENISPAMMEGAFKAIPGVSQVVVIGDRRKYMAALFTLDAEKLPSVLREAGSPARTSMEASTCPKFAAWFAKQVESVNKTLAQVQTIKKWRILPAELSIEGGELTPTMKLKRKVVSQKYASEIESLYV